MRRPLNIVVFASGGGQNARNIFATARQYPNLLKINALICNRKQAGVLTFAEEYQIPSVIIPVPFRSSKSQARLDHEAQISNQLATLAFDYICLAGYMRIFTASFIARYPHPSWPVSKIINIHPSLLPAFKGYSGYADAFHYGVKLGGVTTHFVNEEVDGGLILHQRHFPRFANDTLDSFIERGRQQEYICYRETLLALAAEDFHTQEKPFRLFLSTDRHASSR